MEYTFEAFCRQARSELQVQPNRAGRDAIRQLLEALLTEKAFRSKYLGDEQPRGMRTIYQDHEAGFVVLAYIMDEPKQSPPHDHGSSWAIYGQAVGYTDMTEYRRLDGGISAGKADLEETARYRLNVGEAGLYDAQEIHAIDYPAGARFVRVTGADLNFVPRLKYDIVSGVALEVSSSGVST